MLVLGLFLVTSLLVLMFINTRVRSIIDSSQSAVYEKQLEIVLQELREKNDQLNSVYARKARLGAIQNAVLEELRQNYLADLSGDVFPFIVDESGNIIMHPSLPKGNRSLAPFFSTPQLDAHRGKMLFRDSTGEERWGFFARFPEWQWIICWSVPVKTTVAAFTQLRNQLAMIMGGALIIMGLALVYFITRILQPIARLTMATRNFAEGDLRRIDVTGNDEIGTLARAFDRMQQTLAAKIAQLHKSEIKYRSLVQHANSIILRWDKKGRVIFINDFGENLFGFRREELVGKNVVGTIVAKKGSTGRDLTSMIDAILTTPTKYTLNENENICRDGRRVWIQWSNNAIVDEQGEFLEMLSVGIDITERKETETLLRETENRYRALFESANDAIMIRDEDGICIDCNRKALELFMRTREEVTGHPPEHLTLPAQPDGSDSHAKAKQMIKKAMKGEPQSFEWMIQRADGKLRDVIVNANCFEANGKKYVQSVLVDITRRKRMESELRQARKMEGIGTLAGGIAHDFNNILSAIIGYTELAQMKIDDDSELARDLSQVRKASERAKGLVRQILTFSRKETGEEAILQISLVVKEALKLIRSSIPSTIEIVQDISSTAPVLTDPTRIHQLIMNLCTNASQAMMDTGGRLTVSMHEVAVNQEDYPELELDEGNYVRIEVSDTGCGMDEETLANIFDPFFTTKEQGCGTGLGLAVVYDIVTGMKGGISVTSQPGAGTTFYIYLPIAKEKNTVSATPPVQESIVAGNEQIMVVDDEEAIRDLLRAIFAGAGYRVLVYPDGREAWEAFRQEPDKWNLIVTDQTMPFMTGEELAVKVMEMRPEIPVILCTGYSESISEEKAFALGIKNYLHKPISLNRLLASVRKAMEGNKEHAD
jgi:PAS domain S-box-containing protein